MQAMRARAFCPIALQAGSFISLPMRLWLLVTFLAALPIRAADSDPYLWLEAIDDPKALAWVKEHNAATAERLKSPLHDELYRQALAVLDSASRLPEVVPHGRHVYNFWQDREHVRGIYRRTTLDELSRDNPRWETVLDIDALAKREGKPWAWNGATWLTPEENRCLIRLAPGGGDAVEVREFDPEKLEFVRDGFLLPLAKVRVAWRDANSLYVGTDFGPGSLTASGYPRVVKVWQRGTPLAAAETVFEGDAKSVAAFGRRIRTQAGHIDLVSEGLTFWTSRHAQLIDGGLRRLEVPPTANVVDGIDGQLVLWLKEDWGVGGRTLVAGTVVAADPATLRAGGTPKLEVIVAPTAAEVVKDVDVTSSGVLVTMLENVRGRLNRFVRDGGGWKRQAIALPDNGSVSVLATNEQNGDAFVRFETFVTPPALYHLPANATTPRRLRAQEPAFDGSRFEVEQLWAVSADGTRVPDFVVAPKGLKRDGTAPTWMFSYGGFENALTPSYSGSYEVLHGAYGKLWLERGGVFVLANIRGGGEFGPQWHRAVLKEKHYKCFEDFEAVARDLASRKITSARHLGIEGRSNGGLLVAATMLRHPDLYGAVVCGNPLLDMQRYDKLLAGASWVGEYGDPDVPAEWDYISRYSPYQRIRPGLKLPPILFYTSTRDDRVHPGHARKMAAKMEAMGYPVEYFENTEGGHRGSTTHEQLATRLARAYAFLWRELK